MAGSESVFKGITIGEYDQESNQLANDLTKFLKDDVIFFCVGTDRNTGDSFAPFVGTYLKEKGYKNVIGTIDSPVHANNIEEKIKEIPEGKTVIAIDACLGKLQNVGKLFLKSGSLYPGKGVGKNLPTVGDFHIQGIVNVNGESNFLNHVVLGSTRLSTVLKMANQCAASIESAFPLNEKGKLNKII